MTPAEQPPLFAAAMSALSTSIGGSMLGWSLSIGIPVAVFSAAIFYMLSRPLRRQEQARFLLDLIESAIQQGQSIERYVISLSQARETSLGARFHRLAKVMERGCGLVRALETFPHLLPRQVPAMLKTGETLGDFSRVLPACRNVLQDGTSQSRALINYQLTFAFFVNPMALLLALFIFPKIYPVFMDISHSLGIQAPPFFANLGRMFPLLIAVQLILVIIVYLSGIFLLGGARFMSWVEAECVGFTNFVDWLAMRVPWRRKRLLRDFSAMLGLLLDGGVPEHEAVYMAASGTANQSFMRRAEQARDRLLNGAKLTEAIQSIDDTGEFRWRLTNAAAASGSFFKALKGWHETLDAMAFKQEQAAAQVISTALTLLNAVTVTVIALGIFQLISQLSVTIYSKHF